MAWRDEASAHDPEGGERGEQAAGMAASQYGAAERGAHTRPAQSRAWALGAVVLTCALVAAAHMTQHPTAAAELVARGRKVLAGQALKMEPLDDYVVKKSSFTKGEAHMINDVFNQESSKEELTDPVYGLVHPELLLELQKEIEREMQEEVDAAVKKEQQEYYLRTTATIQKEMGAVMDDVDKQKKNQRQVPCHGKASKGARERNLRGWIFTVRQLERSAGGCPEESRLAKEAARRCAWGTHGG